MSTGEEQLLAALASRLAALDGEARRSARLLVHEEGLRPTLRARLDTSRSKLFDSVAKFGGGSLLTSVLLLILGGRFETGVLGVAVATLIALLGGTMSTVYYDRRAAWAEYRAGRLAAALKEVER